MDGINKDENMNIKELMTNATEVTGKTSSDNIDESQLSTTVGGNWWEKTGAAPEAADTTVNTTVNTNTETITAPDAGPSLPNDNVNLSSGENYEGPGLVVNEQEVVTQETEQTNPKFTGVTPETQGYVDDYLKEMDKDIEVAKDLADRKQAEMDEAAENEEEDENGEKPMTKDEFERVYSEAVVVIDKTGMGSVINFTDEEREKLEKVKKIKIEEVETISLQSIKTKKMKKKENLDKILKRQVNIHTTPIVLPASGYTATMRGCSTYELISLMGNQQNVLMDTETKWSLIHSKLDDTSIGKMEYNEFLLHTAAVDYNIFLYGLLCATYPDDDKIPLKCEKCGKEFDHHYSIKSLIRAEKMSDKMKDLVVATIDASHMAQDAKGHHDAASVNQVKTFRLPVSGFIVEMYVQSAYDFINKSIKELSENKDPKYNQASVLSSVIRKLYIPDPDAEDEEFFEVEGALDVAKSIYQLGDTDILVLTKQGEIILEDLSFEFGLMNVQCPHCKHQTLTVPMDLESILFYKYQQAMTTKIE